MACQSGWHGLFEVRQSRASLAGFYTPSNLAISGNSASFDVIDGGWGDEDLSANGEIVDPSVPVLFDLSVAPVPALSRGMLLVLLAALLLLTIGGLRCGRSEGGASPF